MRRLLQLLPLYLQLVVTVQLLRQISVSYYAAPFTAFPCTNSDVQQCLPLTTVPSTGESRLVRREQVALNFFKQLFLLY